DWDAAQGDLPERKPWFGGLGLQGTFNQPLRLRGDLRDAQRWSLPQRTPKMRKPVVIHALMVPENEKAGRVGPGRPLVKLWSYFTTYGTALRPHVHCAPTRPPQTLSSSLLPKPWPKLLLLLPSSKPTPKPPVRAMRSPLVSMS